ncbi:hypothetical protein [Lysobacter sp. HA18]
MEFFSSYYAREFNIELIPFSMDDGGWNHLANVIEFLAAEIPVSAPLATQRRLEMEQLLDD